MLCYTVYTLLIAGLASQTLAEAVREPYQPKLARMSTRNILGLQRRALDGYAPMEQLCGEGDTCAEACGKGFKQCASKDKLTHCYNPLKKQTCCPGGSGDSCDNGYFCTSDEKKETWCCPDGLSLKECAQKYNIPGPLTSQAPPTPTTTTSKSSTTTKASVTKDPSTTEDSTTTVSTEKTTTSTKSKKPETTESTTTKSKPEETSTVTSPAVTTTLLIDVSSAALSTEAGATPVDSASSSTLSAPASTSSVSESGSSGFEPSHSLMFFIVGALVVLA
ncbi:hypothetical protein GGR51DRAFT_267681 [Nemania sp. FL0031]|nr:hypothetical protein GGR51DRAFT_267681 [Nemania sp. FL0031]